MNNVFKLGMPLLAFGVLRFLFNQTASQVVSLGAAGEGASQNAADVASGKMMQAVLDSLGAGALSQPELALVTLLFIAYSTVFGFLSEIVFGARAFGRYLNGFICLLGGTLGLIGYTRLVGKLDGNGFGLSIVVVVLGSTLLLFGAALVKSWILGKADDFMTGVWEVKSLQRVNEATRAPTARDRLASVTKKRSD